MRHPELREGEIFLGNFTKNSFSNIGWKTKRWGSCSYDIYGDPIKKSFLPSLFPVFVQRKEIEHLGFNIDEENLCIK